MAKVRVPITSKVGRLVSPKPTVLVTCVDAQGRANIITIAAVTTVSHDPPMFMIAVNEERYSHHMIEETREFVINVPPLSLLEQTHLAGSTSGRGLDKFKEAGFKARAASEVRPPLIEDCPINIECRVVQAVKPGSHTIFVGEVVTAHVEEGLFDGERLDLAKLPTILYNYEEYLAPGPIVKRFKW